MKMLMLTGPFQQKVDLTEEQGFTFFEVVLVLIIVSLLTIAVLSRNSPVAAQAKLQGEVELLKTQLRYAQARALNANQVWGMTVDNNRVWLFTGGDINNRVKLPGENGDFVDYANDSRKVGLTVAGAVPPFIVSFDDRGQPHTDAAAAESALATAPVVMTVSDGTTSTQIDITPNTGFIQ